MTHDPREALEIVQQMIRGKPMSAWITDTRTMKSLGDVVQEALTASPGEQEQPAAAGWNEAINWLEGIARNDGNADQLAAQRCVAILRAGQDFRREAPAPEGVDRPDAGGSDPTAERREIVALGDLVTVNELAPYFGDWRGVTLKVVGLRLTPDGEEWASVIEGDQRHRGNGQYDGETDGFNVQWLSKCAALDGGAGA